MNINVKGFTLIELMIVVAIIAILSAIALPAYNESVRKTKRAEAVSVLTEGAQRLEVFFSQNGRYCADAGCSGIADVFQVVIPTSGTPYYTIASDDTALTLRTFTLTATPEGSMAGDDCGTLSINQSGLTTATGSLGVAGCWRR